MNDFKDITRTLTVAVCIALAGAIASTVLMFTRGIRDDVYAPPEPPSAEEEKFDPELSLTYDYGDIYIEKMVIFCDSTFAEASKFNVLSQSAYVVTGNNGDMPLDFNSASSETDKPASDGAVRSITDIVSEQTPQYLLISIGLKNGVEHCSEEKFKQYYQKLIDTVAAASPDTKIILQSVLPVSQAVSKSVPAISIDKIDKANDWIYELALSNSLRYLNSAEALKNDKGYLNGEFDGGDGIHLNEKGYKALIEYIKTHGYR